MIILGIDPGLNATGYGIIDALPSRLRVVTAGNICPPRQQPLADRLGFIHSALSGLIEDRKSVV